jgi:cardiolipin synthase
MTSVFYPRIFFFIPATNFSPSLRKRRLRVLVAEYTWRTSTHMDYQCLFFSHTAHHVRALKKASLRGVDVRIMVPAHSDVEIFPALASTYYADMLRAGIHIHEYEEGILHSKIY